MANQPSSFILFLLSFLFVISIFPTFILADSHFEGFDGDTEDYDHDYLPIDPSSLKSHPLTQTPSSDLPNNDPTNKAFEFWDDDEFEGIPDEKTQIGAPNFDENVKTFVANSSDSLKNENVKGWGSFRVEIFFVGFLIVFGGNYFYGKRENERIALSWAALFAGEDSIFEKNFSLVGVGDGDDDSPLLLKEGQNVFKFYASGRRYCQGMLATMVFQSRQDLIWRLYNMVVPRRDEIIIEVYMNEDAMDHVVFALAKKKAVKTMHKDERDLQRFANVLSSPPNGKKWVADELAVISESKEVAAGLITEAVLDQVFGDKAFEKFGKKFISMHFSDQHPGSHRKVLVFKFVLPGANNMADMTRLVSLVPYYIDLIGRYKLSPQAQSRTETARLKVAQEIQKELHIARQEALQIRKVEKKLKKRKSVFVK